MNLKIVNSSTDFIIYYLSTFLEKKQTSFFKKTAIGFGITENWLDNLGFKNEDFNKYIINNINPLKKEDSDFFLKNYFPTNSANIKILEEGVSKNISTLENFLRELFGSKSDIKEIEISLIPSNLMPREDFLSFPASVHEKVPNKIYLVIHIQDNLENEDILLMYLKTTFHEFSHIFLNLNQEFSDILRTEWIKNYKNINPREYRKRIKELIASSLFYYKDFGFAYSVLGLRENLKEKEDSLKKNKYRKITFDFLGELKNSSDKDKLENLLPVYIDELTKGGLFLEK